MFYSPLVCISIQGKQGFDNEMKSRTPIIICFPFSGDVVGGSHISVLGLIRTLDPEVFRPLIVPQIPDGNIAKMFHEHDLETETSFRWAELGYDTRVSISKFLETMTDLPAQIKFLRKHGVDIVHTNDGRTHATWALAARLAGAKLLWHHRGDPTALGLRLVAPLLANRVATVSQFALPAPGLYSAAHKAQVVHSPFDTDIVEDRRASRTTIVEELGCDPNTQLIGYLGAFVARKRPFLFIETIAELLKRRPTETVIGLMFGEAYDDTTQEALVRHAESLGVTNCIKFMGLRKRGTFWLAGCDVLLIPAVGEPFGRTLIEAMLVGTPVVATASGGNIEALREGQLGLLVSPENAGALAEGCLRFRDDPKFTREIVERTRSDARARFGIKHHADLITAIYAEMLGIKQSQVPTVGAESPSK
jgi:glycosyltransferase involved in cell wall biosynthesis